MSASSYHAAANQLTYTGFCALGALTNPRLYTRTDRYGNQTYWMASL